MNKGLVKGAVIDVWGNEPHISQDLLDKVFIGTPHIAGYSADGKANATRMVLEAFCRFFHKQADFHIALPDNPNQTLSQDENVRVLQLYNPTQGLRRIACTPGAV